jgi:hypothetical protein
MCWEASGLVRRGTGVGGWAEAIAEGQQRAAVGTGHDVLA